MARRGQSPIEDLIDLAALLPAWLSMLFAVICYFILHHYSSMEIPAASPTDIPQLFYASLARHGAAAGQYLLPMIFGFGAVLSFFKRSKRKKLIRQTQARGKTSSLLDMSWREFEQLVGASFSRRGYAVQENGGAGPDGGVDLILTRNKETFLVQCKQWRAQQVGVAIVRELYGVMAARGATGGFVVSSGSFSADAVEFAAGRNIELVGGEELLAFIATKAAGEPTAVRPAISPPRMSPDCPACGAMMVKRIASRGKHAGSAFWGCTVFPGCRGTRPLKL